MASQTFERGYELLPHAAGLLHPARRRADRGAGSAILSAADPQAASRALLEEIAGASAT